jgi:hypothetical protein
LPVASSELSVLAPDSREGGQVLFRNGRGGDGGIAGQFRQLTLRGGMGQVPKDPLVSRVDQHALPKDLRGRLVVSLEILPAQFREQEHALFPTPVIQRFEGNRAGQLLVFFRSAASQLYKPQHHGLAAKSGFGDLFCFTGRRPGF